MTDVRITISYAVSGSGAGKLPAGMRWEREHAVGANPLLFTDELQRVLKEDMEQVLEAIAKLDPRTKETEPNPED
jgi:hypothetical protein